MLKISLAIIAFCGMLSLGACAGNQTAGTPASAPNDAATSAPPSNTPAQAAAAVSQEPDYPQPAIVMPPRPKPGAPHGPGFDMPLLDVEGYMPPRPMDVLKDAHIFTADHPEVASYVPCYCDAAAAVTRTTPTASSR